MSPGVRERFSRATTVIMERPSRKALSSQYLSLLVCVFTLTSCAGTLDPIARLASGERVTHTWLDADVSFATVAEAQTLLGTADAFTQALTTLDRSLRLKTPSTVSPAAHLTNARQAARSWTREELEEWRPAVNALTKALQRLSLPLPSRILIIRTDGTDELAANYTRTNAIILPRPASDTSSKTLKDRISLLAHELFHIASRHAEPELLDRLYALAGFHRVDPGRLPAAIASRRLTNPDAMSYDHAITVSHRRFGAQDVIPVLVSRVRRYQIRPSIRLSSVMSLRLMPLDSEGRFQAATRETAGFGIQETDYVARTGINTGYIIHPEEIIADNFALLVLKYSGYAETAKRPEVLERLATTLQNVTRH